MTTDQLKFEDLRIKKEREFKFTRRDFEYIQKLVGKRVGINLTDAKQELVYNRLTKRLRALKLTTFKEYCEYVANHEEEITSLINSITTNLTHFFREDHHFEFLVDKILPEIKQSGSRKVKIWSAGCSSGEEPYSIAIALNESLENFGAWDVSIFASDIDTNIITLAQKGVYKMEKVQKVSKDILAKWFFKGKGQNAGLVKVHNDLKRKIQFEVINLHGAWSFPDKLDVIFCRNVMIYFDKFRQREVVSRFAHALKPKGYLIVGHSENLFGVTSDFAAIGKTIYQKKN